MARRTPPLGTILQQVGKGTRKKSLAQLVRIAPNRATFYREKGTWDGWRNSSGRIYLLCPMHLEKTPSLVLYSRVELRGRKYLFSPSLMKKWREQLLDRRYDPGGTHRRSRISYADTIIGKVFEGLSHPHFHCYGCGWQGCRTTLVRFLLTLEESGCRHGRQRFDLERRGRESDQEYGVVY